MSFTINKSAISEVRDQLSLDFADGEYLDVIAQNLGLRKQLFTVDDSIWRAVVKVLAIEYKQVATKFHDLLEIIFGPKETQVTSLAANVLAGDKTCFVTDSSNLPQVGTLVFDENLGNEETLNYVYIDRTTNEVVLETEFASNHLSHPYSTEVDTLAISSIGQTVVTSAEFFPTVGSYNVVVDRGQPTEASYLAGTSVVGGDDPTRLDTLLLTPSPFGDHSYSSSSDTIATTAQPYVDGSVSIYLEDSSEFPDSGTLKFVTSSVFIASVDSSGFSTKTVTFAGGTLPADDSLNGYEIWFGGTGITGTVRRIVSHTDSIITFDRDFTGVADYPRAGDAVILVAIASYISNDYSQNALNLLEALPSVAAFPAGAQIDLLNKTSTVSYAPVQCKGTGWDVIQSDPKLVEVYIPESIRGSNDIRSASYIHDDNLPSGALSVLSLGATPGDSFLTITPVSTIPVSGVLDIDSGAEIVSFNKIQAELATRVEIGDNTIRLKDSNFFPSSGTFTLSVGTPGTEALLFNANDTGTGTLSLVGSATKEHRADISVVYENILELSTVVQNVHAVSTPIFMYNPQHAGTSVPIGDFNQDPDTWPGPYVYSIFDNAPTGLGVSYASDTVVPGPSLLAIDQGVTHTCLEVVSALAMDTALTKPFTVSLGRESKVVNSISMHHDTASTVAVGGWSQGDQIVDVTDLTGFPQAIGYRVVIDELGPNQEVVYVVERVGDTLRLQSPLSIAHSAGESVTLMSDVLVLDTALSLNHTGLVPYGERSTAIAAEKGYFNTSMVRDYTRAVRPTLDCFTLDTVVGLSTDGGTVLFNFGDSLLEAEDSVASIVTTTVTLNDASAFPSVYPYEIIVAPGTRKQEFLLVTGKAGNDLTVSFAPFYTHSAGTSVSFTPGSYEVLDYNSVDTLDLCFDLPIVLNYTHYPAETIFKSSERSIPRDNGYDFPFRIPVDLTLGVRYLIEYIRAAGVQVDIISER